MRDLIDARDFVEATLYKIPPGPIKACCSDGRYETKNALRWPGADPGFVLCAIAALRELRVNFDLANAWRAVMQVVGREQNFHYHSDTLTDCIYSGCGHLAAAKKTPDAYGVLPDDMIFVCKQLKLLHGKGIKPVRLWGEHTERAVFVLDSNSRSMHTAASGFRSFICQRTLHAKRLETVAATLHPLIKQHNPKVGQVALLQALKKCSARQFEASLSRIAPSLPYFLVATYPGTDGAFDVSRLAAATSTAVD